MITGLTRVRNEEVIITDTLNHMEGFCDEVYVYDDASTDKTLNLCMAHSAVTGILPNKQWQTDRAWAETTSRKQLLEMAQKYTEADPHNWFVYMDADERIEFDWNKLTDIPLHITGVKMKLFDYYITAEDVSKHYTERRWIGPEYREILMAFRNIDKLQYIKPDQRSPIVPGRKHTSGYVRHYGKAVSIQQWEETCDYYAKHFPKYAEKWKARKGKAIHTRSDFGRPLCLWEEREKYGIKLY